MFSLYESYKDLFECSRIFFEILMKIFYLVIQIMVYQGLVDLIILKDNLAPLKK